MHTTTSRIEIDAPSQKVWDGLTRPELVKRWQYGSQLSTTWEPGTAIRFRSEWEGQVFEQWGKVIEFTPTKVLKYSLFAPRPDLTDAPENYFVMSYALEETGGGGTVLTITQDDPRPGAGEGRPDSGDEGDSVLKILKALAEAE